MVVDKYLNCREGSLESYFFLRCDRIDLNCREGSLEIAASVRAIRSAT